MEREAFVMSENVLAKLTSRKWLREAVGGRVRDFVHSFNFSPHTIEREVVGEKYQFYIGSITGQSWYGSTIDNSKEMGFVKRKLVKPGMVVIECGAHHGAQSILLSRWAGPQGKVVAAEPMQENVSILKTNIELNNLTNVILVEKAVGSPRDETVSMGQSSNSSVRKSSKDTIPVESITIDKLAETLKITPTLLKIDVEGYEYEILEGSRSVLATTPAIFIEVHTRTLPRYRQKLKDLWKFIDSDRYDIYIQDEDFKDPEPYRPGTVPTDRVHLFFGREAGDPETQVAIRPGGRAALFPSRSRLCPAPPWCSPPRWLAREPIGPAAASAAGRRSCWCARNSRSTSACARAPWPISASTTCAWSTTRRLAAPGRIPRGRLFGGRRRGPSARRGAGVRHHRSGGRRPAFRLRHDRARARAGQTGADARASRCRSRRGEG